MPASNLTLFPRIGVFGEHCFDSLYTSSLLTNPTSTCHFKWFLYTPKWMYVYDLKIYLNYYSLTVSFQRVWKSQFVSFLTPYEKCDCLDLGFWTCKQKRRMKPLVNKFKSWAIMLHCTTVMSRSVCPKNFLVTRCRT